MARPASMRGFTLIEVMIAVVLISLGLLGMALLQSTALRAGQSASARTTATLLTYQILDMVRANRSEAALYGQILPADFIAAGDGRSGVCAAGAALPAPQWQADRALWICSARRSLPEAEGSVVITGAVAALPGPPVAPATPGRITVTISWVDDRVTGARETFTVTSGL